MVIGASIAPTPGTEYSGVFQNYVARSTELLSGQLRNFEGLLSQEQQARVWLTLSYGLRLNWAWPATRELLLAVAPKMEQSGIWDEWLPCLAQGIERSRAVADGEAEAELSLHFGHLLFRMREVEQARQCLEKAERLFARVGLVPRRAMALARLALLVYRADGDQAAAYAHLHHALNLVTHQDPEAAFCHFVHGTLALEGYGVSEAASAFETVRSLAEQAGDRRLNALALLNLGRLYDQRELYEPAETYYEWAITAFAALEDPVNLAVAQMNLGIVYMESGKQHKALRSYNEAETTLRPLHDRRYLAMIYNNKGMAFADLKEWARAEEAYLGAIALWGELNEPVAHANVLDNLGVLYTERGSNAQAVTIFEEAQALLSTCPADSAEVRQLVNEVAEHWQTVLAQMNLAGDVWARDSSAPSAPDPMAEDFAPVYAARPRI